VATKQSITSALDASSNFTLEPNLWYLRFCVFGYAATPVRWMTDPQIAIGNATTLLAHSQIWIQ
jgi:hypothetical protein